MVHVKHFGVIRNGQKIYRNPQRYKQQIALLEGKEFEEVIQEKFEDTTPDQHAYYRAMTRWLTENTETFGGWEASDVHDYVQKECASTIIEKEVNGKMEKFLHVESTAHMGKRRMTQFIDDFSKLVYNTCNCTLPPPTELVIGKIKTR